MKEHKSNYVYGYDESQAIGQAYGATNTPQFFVLDKERKIRYLGAMDDSQRRRQGQEDLPERRGRGPAEGRDARPSKRPSPQGCGVKYKKRNEQPMLRTADRLTQCDPPSRTIAMQSVRAAGPSDRLGGVFH